MCALASDAGLIHAMLIERISCWELEYALRAPGRKSLAGVKDRMKLGRVWDGLFLAVLGRRSGLW